MAGWERENYRNFPINAFNERTVEYEWLACETRLLQKRMGDVMPDLKFYKAGFTTHPYGGFETFKPDVVIYDVLGDVVCGGFAMPIREGYAREVFIVSSGEMMSLYAANNIAQAIKNFGRRGYARLGGLILNAKNIENEQQIVADAVKEIGTEVIAYVPRCGDIQKAESQGGTIFQCLAESSMRDVYSHLANQILKISQDFVFEAAV